MLAVLLVFAQLAVLPLVPKAHADPVQIVLTSGSTWTVPPAWDNGANTIEAIGAGGNGSDSTASTNSGGGGGGGEYRKSTNVTLTPNTVISTNIPAAGAGSTAAGAYVKNNAGLIIVEAKNGGNASGNSSGSGGSGGTGAIHYNGGSGGAGVTGNRGSGGGGGAAAGPAGIGRNGGSGASTTSGGGGGGGSNGGSSTAGSNGVSNTGGNGGANSTGSGAGAGGSRNNNDAAAGTNGGGGGGAGVATGSTDAVGANGSVEDVWGSGLGPSGGGGGGGGGGTSATGNHGGGSAGGYGGGGGGAGITGNNTHTGGASGQGIIVITYTPSVSPSVDQAAYRLFSNPNNLGSTPWQSCRTEGGETTIGSGLSSTTVTLAKSISDITQAFLLVSSSGDGSVSAGNGHMVAGSILDSSTLTFTRGASPAADTPVSYSLVECFHNEISVQRGQTIIASGATSNTASIAAVNTSNSLVIISSYDDDSSNNEQTGLATGALQNATTIILQRNDAASVNDTVRWQVVEVSATSGATVQTGETTLGSNTASTTTSIGSVNTASSWLYCSYDADSNGLQQTAVGCDLTDSTTLTFNRYASKNYNNRIRWYVVSFPSTTVGVQRGAWSDAGGTTDGVRYDVDIPINQVNSATRAFGYITNTASGTGTAFPRNAWISQLMSTTNLQMTYWRGSSSGAGTHYWQVIEFLPADADVGAVLAAQNTSSTLVSAARSFRLRMLLSINDATIPQGTGFKLQYAPFSGSCAASSYNDITTATPLAFRDITQIPNGSTVTTNSNDPSSGSDVVVPQTYIESSSFANDLSVLSPGQAGEWDFSLVDNGAPASTSYCLRAVYADGSPLESYTRYPQVTISDGVFSVKVVNGSGGTVSNPGITMSGGALKFSCSETAGVLGTSNQKVRVTNHSAGTAWTLSIAATDGATAAWTDGSDTFDFNDPTGSPPGCSEGADADSRSGLLAVSFAGSTVTPSNGCTSDGVTTGISTAFEQGVTDDITLGRASSTAVTGCYWDYDGIDLAQTIPAEQKPGTYTLDLTITLTAN